MLTMDAGKATLLVIDLQARLMPAIANAEEVIANAQRLLEAAKLLDVPPLFTEQYPRGLGSTVKELAPPDGAAMAKTTFDAMRTPEIEQRLAGAGSLVVAGCEAHVCVLQTVLGLLDRGRKVFVVADAIGSRRVESRAMAIERMRQHGAEVVTTEMVVFEWLETSENPKFRQVSTLIR